MEESGGAVTHRARLFVLELAAYLAVTGIVPFVFLGRGVSGFSLIFFSTWIVQSVVITIRTRRAYRLWDADHRRRSGYCVECGYDLSGSVGRCPECGHHDERRDWSE